MSERTSYKPGTPSWVDLGSPDPDAAVEFYGALFGWEVRRGGRTPSRPVATGWRRCAARRSAGMMPLMQEGQPPAWTTYVSVEDADATAAAVSEAGGSVIVEPMDVLDVGRMAVFADPTGAVFGDLAAARLHAGSGLVNEPGAFTWNELNTRDPDAARAFYGSGLRLGAQRAGHGRDGHLHRVEAGRGLEVGGMMDMRGRVPDEVPAHWLTYFAVEDTDAAVEKVKELGGGVAFGPIDIMAGRFAVVHDPHGATFAVIKMAEESAARSASRRGGEVGPRGSDRRRLGRVAGLALVLPFGGLAEAGALDDLQSQHRALHPRRRDLDPEQVEDELLGQPQQLLARSCRPARR